MTPQAQNAFPVPGAAGKVPPTFPNPAVPVGGVVAEGGAGAGPVSQPIAASESSQNPNFGAIDDFTFPGMGENTEPLLTDFDFDSFLNTDTAGGDLNFDFAGFTTGMGDDATLEGGGP